VLAPGATPAQTGDNPPALQKGLPRAPIDLSVFDPCLIRG
jgi:hypothetical protein